MLEGRTRSSWRETLQLAVKLSGMPRTNLLHEAFSNNYLTVFTV